MYWLQERTLLQKAYASSTPAGATKYQTVLLNSGYDQSVLYQCSFDVFQDTCPFQLPILQRMQHYRNHRLHIWQCYCSFPEMQHQAKATSSQPVQHHHCQVMFVYQNWIGLILSVCLLNLLFKLDYKSNYNLK